MRKLKSSMKRSKRQSMKRNQTGVYNLKIYIVLHYLIIFIYLLKMILICLIMVIIPIHLPVLTVIQSNHQKRQKWATNQVCTITHIYIPRFCYKNKMI